MNNMTDINGSAENLVVDRIAQMRDQLLNRLILAAFVLGIFAVSFSVARAFYAGFKPVFYFQMGCICFTLALVVFRKKLSYKVRLYSILAMGISLAAMGVLSFGIMSTGILFFSLSAINASVFASRKLSNILIVLSIATILISMYLFLTDTIKLSFDTYTYFKNPISWFAMMTSFTFMTGIVVTVTASLINSIKMLAVESMQRVLEIEKLNENLEEKIAQRTADLEESNKVKDKIMSVVAHDLINNIGANIAIVELLKTEQENSVDNKIMEYIDMIDKTSKNSIEIVKELRAFTRLQRSEENFLTQDVEMHSFISSIVATHYPRALKKDISLVMSDTVTGVHCKINKAQFSRVLDNLIVNAIKFTHTKGCIKVNVIKDREEFIIEVCDTGIGIPEELKADIFNPYTSSGRIGTSQENTTGLGLSIVKEIVERHNGKISFTSIDGKGTTFIVTIPVTPPA